VNNLFHLPIDPPIARNDPLTPARYHALQVPLTSPIVMDLGSYLVRAGYAVEKEPRLRYPPYAARFRDGPGKSGNPVNSIGYDALSSTSRSAARSAFEGPLAISPWNLERLLDGTLSRLGLGEERVISHPFLMTEPVCNPNGARSILMEILFEAYDARSVAFGIDASFSYLYNSKAQFQASRPQYRNRNALIISCGYSTTTVLPIIDGRINTRAARRLSIGGLQMTSNMAQRLQLLHPEHANALTFDAVAVLKEEFCYVSQDYVSEMNRLRFDEEYFEQTKRAVMMPATEPEKPELTPEEMERKARNRHESGKRLQELLKAKREEKEAHLQVVQEQVAKKLEDKEEIGEDMVEDVPFSKAEAELMEAALESRLSLEKLSDMREGDEDDFYLAVAYRGMKSMEDLENQLKVSVEEVEKLYKSLGPAKGATIERKWRKRKEDEELLAVPDEKLPPERLKDKKRIKAVMAAAEARERAKKQKEQEKAELEAAIALREARKKNDLEGYVGELRMEQELILARRKKRVAAKEAGSDRRSQAARHRMRLLAQQIAPTGKKEVDTFGMDDADWDVYREIEDGADGDDVEDKDRLDEIEREFEQVAPQFTLANRGPARGSLTLYLPPDDPRRIHLVVDRIRTPEIVWQPSIIGLDQMGLGEAMALSLNSISDVIYRRETIRDVFLTGGFAALPGLSERVRLELMRVLPVEWNNDIKVSVAEDSDEDGWKGAALFGRDVESTEKNGWVSRADYNEKGPDYIREHIASNPFIPTQRLDWEKEEERRKKVRVA